MIDISKREEYELKLILEEIDAEQLRERLGME